eukprot:gene10080-11110_t
MSSSPYWDGTIGFIRHIETMRAQRQMSTSEYSSGSEEDNIKADAVEVKSDSGSDLEENLEPTPAPRGAPSLADIYTKTCSGLRIVPCSPFLRQIRDEEIDISHYNVGPTGTKAIANVLKFNTTTTVLNIHDNGIGALGATALASMLQDNCFITVLDISMNFIEESGVKALCDVLKSNKYIVELSLESTKMTSAAAMHVAGALRENYSLRSLNISSNDIGDEGGRGLAKAIRENQSIVYLDISCNNIRKRGAVEIGDAISENATLKTIDLSRNGLADDGAKAFGNALKQNRTLRELNLAENRITENGAWELAIGLEENTALKLLDVGRNPFLTRGAILLAEALITNEQSVLEELYLDDVSVSSDFEPVLAELLKEKQGLYVQFGHILRGEDHRKRGKQQKDLVSRILDSVELRGMRIVDFFRAMDKKGRLAITKQEFITGLKTAGIPMRKSQVDELFEVLDVDGDGFARYGEFSKVIKKRTHEEFSKTRSNYQWNH